VALPRFGEAVTEIRELLRSGGPTLSVELWPARSEAAATRLKAVLPELAALHPSFTSITYGAGGSTRERTHELVVDLERAGWTVPMAHLVCAAHSRSELASILGRYSQAGVSNILALRGDPPRGASSIEPGELRYAIELVELAREVGDFSVAVAAHPEGHPASLDLASDRSHLADKLQIADFAITQFFFRAEDYLLLVEDLSSRGIDKPVLPGVLPITNATTLSKMTELSATTVPGPLAAAIASVADRPEEVRKIGIGFATDLCEKLLAEGVPGLHFYTMNESAATIEICENLGAWR
jgi:methylenetetrahydrofolate reductase (NADPH)